MIRHSKGAHREPCFAHRARRSFPNVGVERAPDLPRTSLAEVSAAGCQIVRLRAPGIIVGLSGREATACGLGRHVKIAWQLGGTAHVAHGGMATDLHAGCAALMPLAASYHYEADGEHDAVFMIFDTAQRPVWRDLAEARPGRSVPGGSAIAAAQAGITSLLSHADGTQGDAAAVEACLDLMLRALGHDGRPAPDAPRSYHLRRAALLIEQNIGDGRYDPEALARDLGRSRRALYKDFEGLGTTPARFMRQMRLEAAKREIAAAGQRSSLTDIALRHGFPDSASFSHAFRRAFGAPPSLWRRAAG